MSYGYIRISLDICSINTAVFWDIFEFVVLVGKNVIGMRESV